MVIGSVYDIKTKTLPYQLILLGLIMGGLCSTWLVCAGRALWTEWWVALLPAMIWLLLCFVTKGQMGSGDGGVLLALGLLLGDKKIFYICGIALGMSFIISVFLLLTQKANGKTRLPFVPFLLGGYLAVWVKALW